jgi:hypothetical protein
MKAHVRPILDVVTKKHLEVCKCTVCLGEPTKGIICGTLLTYACDKHVDKAIVKTSRFMKCTLVKEDGLQ